MFKVRKQRYKLQPNDLVNYFDMANLRINENV